MPLHTTTSGRAARPRQLGLECLESRTVLTAATSAFASVAALTASAVPSDPRAGEQWAWNNTGKTGGKAGADINATSAWNVTTGSTKTVVAVIDTGVDYRHADLANNIWLNQKEIPASRRANLRDLDGDGLITFRDLNDSRNQGWGKITDVNRNGRIDGGDLLTPMGKTAAGTDTGWGGWEDGRSNDGDAYVDDLVGWNFVTDTNDPMDDFGHGTHVAGTIGAVGGNNIGVTGVNWAVQVMALKFMSSTGAGSVAAFVSALDYAVAHGAKMSNNSWSGAGNSTLLVAAVDRARSKGHIFIAAAGNDGLNTDATPTYPGSLTHDNVVTVAATDSSDRLASYSNYGASSVDIAAPGSDILSTTLGGGYGNNSGTSMAAPHVTGVLALVWSKNPTWSYKQVIAQVLNSGERLATLTGKVKTGARLDAAAAVGAATVASVGPRVLSAIPSGPTATSMNKVRVTFDRAINASTFTIGAIDFRGPGNRWINIVSIVAVAGSGNKVFDVNFATQTVAGSYAFKILARVKDTAWQTVAAYATTLTVKAATTTQTTTTAPRVASAVASGPTATTLNKVRVTFDRAMVPSTFSAGAVDFRGPGNRWVSVLSVVAVAGSGNKVFDVNVATQTVAGSYVFKLLPTVKDTAWRPVTAFSTTFTVKAATSASVSTRGYASSTKVTVTPNNRAVSLLNVPDNFKIADLNVKVNISHPSIGDLQVSVQAPDGTTVVLANRKGGTGDNMTNTVFDDEAKTHIGFAAAPYAGSFQPDVALSNFDGKSAQGTWKLWLTDRMGRASGTLLGWSMSMTARA